MLGVGKYFAYILCTAYSVECRHNMNVVWSSPEKEEEKKREDEYEDWNIVYKYVEYGFLLNVVSYILYIVQCTLYRYVVVNGKSKVIKSSFYKREDGA